MSWQENLDPINRAFVESVDGDRLPKRQPGSRAVFTCMDPRVNLAAVGISAHDPNGESESTVRIVRTLGGRIDDRSLFAAIYLAGAHDILILTHTDCGATLAHESVRRMLQSLVDRTEPAMSAAFLSSVGTGDNELRKWLRTFTDPSDAAIHEVDRARSLDFVPNDVAITGAVYDVTTARIHLVTSI